MNQSDSPIDDSPTDDSGAQHPAERRPRSAGGISRIYRLCGKELKETLRDRRTIITLLLMPILVYPLLSMALNRFVLSSSTSENMPYILGVASDREGETIEQLLNQPGSRPPDEILKASGGELASFGLKTIRDRSLDDALDDGIIDVALKIQSMADGTPQFTMTSHMGRPVSQSARRILVERLQWLRLANTEAIANRAAPQLNTSIDIDLVDRGEAETTSMLGTVIPLVLVLMTITGAVYPAIDLTAGERERGTMEALMASPVPRGYVLVAKYCAVVAVSLLTAIANLLAMFTTLWASGLLGLLSGDGDFSFFSMLQVLVLLVLFSAFFSAVLLSLTSFAKSFKEAQAYLIPVMLLSLAPAMLSLMPGVTLSGPMAIAPLINIVLLARDVLSNTVEPTSAFVAVVSTIAYAGAALGVAARLFGGDAVTRTSNRSIGSIFRRPETATDVPSISAAALLLALLVPIYFVVSNSLMRLLTSYGSDIPVNLQLLFNATALAGTFGLVPFLASRLGRNRWLTTYRLHRPALGSWLGAVLIGVAAWTIAHEVFVFADQAGIGGLGEDKIEMARKQVAKMRTASPLLILFAFAVTPAVVEELCFRGYLFSAFRKVMTPAHTVLATAFLFGLFHVLTGNALLVERFLPSTLMGLIIGWVAMRTGSVFPGIVIHFVHNGLLNIALIYEDRLSFLGEGFDNQAHLPISWIGGGAVLLVLGWAIVWWSTRTRASVAPVLPAASAT
ncbi:MAG: ABC transporter permease subunit/CPBP intramembrane protease [Planctomycetota bacterium]